MGENRGSSIKRRLGLGPSLLVMGMALGVAGTANAQDDAAATGDDEIVVTGFRGSLAASLEVKRNATGFVDAITAEDIADFPDSNLAEAVQRIPGVAIDRDAGEGRTVSVRGLGADFTRVRINGMETLTTTGGTDSSGGANRGRGFDFNVFAAELFSNITVTKSGSASTEEGSLGATVDLRAPRPFDFGDEPVFAASAQAGFNDLSEETDPRATLLFSNTMFDGKFGFLFSVAYSNRSLLEEGFSAVRWANNATGGLTNAPPAGVCGVASNSPAPVGHDCWDASTAAETATLAWEDTADFSTPAGLAVMNNEDTFWPRIPRYGRLTHEQDRLGITTSMQFKPFETTLISFDLMYSDFQAFRQEDFLENFGFSRSTSQGGIGVIDVVDAEVDANGQLTSGTFNDVWLRSESRQDELDTRFQQYVLSLEQDLGDRLHMTGMLGSALSNFKNPVQTTFFVDSFVSGYSLDFSQNESVPSVDFGTLTNSTSWGALGGTVFDPTNPAHWQWRSSGSGAGLNQQPFAEIRMRPQGTKNLFTTGALDFEFVPSELFTIRFGGSYKKFEFSSFENRRFTQGTQTSLETSVPTAQQIASIGGIAAITNLLEGFGSGLDADVPSSWLRPNFDGLAGALDIYCNCVNAYSDFRLSPLLSATNAVQEEDTGGYVQLNWRAELGAMTFRGDVGARYVETQVSAEGIFANVPVSVENKYNDTLPSLNLVLEIMEDFQIRFAAAKVMARPSLPSLTPGGALTNISAGGFSASLGNPLLDPFRADTYDLGFEWYFADEALLSVAFFQKNIDSFIQRQAATGVLFSSTGLDPALNPFGDITGTVNQFVNTPGGELKGYEISYQQPFSFLPGLLANTGVVLNYTHVESEITYFLNAAGTNTVSEDLTGLSPQSWNATLYYEDDKLSARVAANFRDEYLQTAVPANNNALQGKAEVMSVDASASYVLNDNLSLTFEGINLTDEFNLQWSGSADRSRQSPGVYHHTGRQYYLGLRYKY
jgi:iron complex outermembrane recepter protein